MKISTINRVCFAIIAMAYALVMVVTMRVHTCQVDACNREALQAKVTQPNSIPNDTAYVFPEGSNSETGKSCLACDFLLQTQGDLNLAEFFYTKNYPIASNRLSVPEFSAEAMRLPITERGPPRLSNTPRTRFI